MPYRSLASISGTLLLLVMVLTLATCSSSSNTYAPYDPRLTASAIIRGATETTSALEIAGLTGTAAMGGRRLDRTDPTATSTDRPSWSQVTATAIIAGATASRRAIQQTQTQVAIQASATPTRDPQLPTNTPPGEIQQTATAIIAGATETSIAWRQVTHEAHIARQQATRDTATEIARYRATRTQIAVTRDPSIIERDDDAPIERTATQLYVALTNEPRIPNPNCETAHIAYEVESEALDALAKRILTTTTLERGVRDNITIRWSVEAVGMWSAETGVCDEGEPLRTTVAIDYSGMGLREREYADLIHATLAALQADSDILIDAPQRPRLRIRPGLRAQDGVIDADLLIALDAYGEGLRGDALIEAMGGYVWSPGE